MTRTRTALIAGLAALAAAMPVSSTAAPGGARASAQSAAVRTCVEFRQEVGHQAFLSMFANLRDCVRNVAT